MIPVEYLKECFDYDPMSGVISWRDRPDHHFASAQAKASWEKNRRLFPVPFRKVTTGGYLEGSVRYDGERYYLLAHRVAWALVTGEWPEDEIDHRNRIGTQNHLANLRPATRNLNGFNRSYPSNATGYVGVQATTSGRFAAKIRTPEKKVYLGTYDTAEEASRVYRAAALLLHGNGGRVL